MVSDGGVEAVIIGTPHPVHAEHAVAAAKAGAVAGAHSIA